ncbi:hypothetical protein [Streptomyces capitiformicae]|nr:hypothetical protein [Streptomyces capitiformicae]
MGTSSVRGSEEERGPVEEERQEAVVLMHHTSAARASGGWGFDASAMLERAGVHDGKWFVLGADGSYDVHRNSGYDVVVRPGMTTRSVPVS